HHNSVWITHHDVNGHNFWTDRTGATIRHKRIVKYTDQGETSSLVAENEWTTKEGEVLLTETRTIAVTLLPNKEWLLIIDLELNANDDAVTLGKTPFGMIGVRMAKTIGVHDGGGRIRNSEGAVNEKEVLWKRARWVDYSGPIAPGTTEGVTLFDHPDNPNHPSHFHVRNDGWMGASLAFDAPRQIAPGKPLKLRYGLYVHTNMKPPAAIETQWQNFTARPNRRGRPPCPPGSQPVPPARHSRAEPADLNAHPSGVGGSDWKQRRGCHQNKDVFPPNRCTRP
ncbi:MAG: DUF6807 domain-containing protein, partial [Planctomycetota bacterium]